SAYQIEGDITNDWSEWEHSPNRLAYLKRKGLNPHDFICGKACGSYRYFNRDLACLKELGVNAYRFSIEWARIEPQPGKYSLTGIKYYQQIIKQLQVAEIEPLVTLWHWTNPLWVAKKGGWTNPETVSRFLDYVKFVIAKLGGGVNWWCVLNEPMIHIFNGYLRGEFPPQKKSPLLAKKVYSNLVAAYCQAYDLIHQYCPRAKVGISQISNYFEPTHHWCPIERGVARLAQYFWNEKFLLSIQDKMDYLGMSYYFHDRLACLPPFKRNQNKETSDMGWEIYPEGIYWVTKRYSQIFHKPILILENGLADAQDKKRVQFIRQHLKFIHRAIQEGVQIKGYFHWSLIDNFEWAHGWEPKFGLYQVDRQTFHRIAHPSAHFYAQICRTNCLF
ncbi:glycoside hydrolase family 1 protein, partial [Candidatus Parcubacteria bacterium]